MKNIGNNQSDIKFANQWLIVSEIMRCGSLARTDLSKRLKLSNPSISKNVEDLIGRGLLIETGTADTVVGRKPVMLTFNSRWGCVAAIDLSSDHLRIALSDMKGNITKSKTICDVFTINRAALKQVMDDLEQMVEEQKNEYGSLCAICIGSPGDIDNATGYYIFAPRFEEAAKINLREMFEERFHVKTIVKNDINLAVNGENLYGKGFGMDNLIYICVDYGIGSGLILNGKLYEGKRGFAGEIGLLMTNYQKVLPPDSKFDNRDSLDHNVSVFGIGVNIKEMILNGEKSTVMRYCKSVDDIKFEHIIEGFQQHDEVCRQAVRKSAIYLACTIRNINELLDLDRVIIGGSILRLGDEYIEMVRTFLLRNSETYPPEIKRSVLNSQATIYGAVGEAISFALRNAILCE